MNFVKTFLAGLLAVIVGTFLVFFLWIFILLGIAGSMEKSVAVHPESILKIDFSEVLTDAPLSDPLAGIDLMTLQTTRQLSLFKALRAIEAAGADDRIKGIYLRMNGGGGVTGSALLEELREALLEFKQSGKFIVAAESRKHAARRPRPPLPSAASSISSNIFRSRPRSKNAARTSSRIPRENRLL